MTKRLLCSNLPSLNKPVHLSEDEAHHATRVIRLRDGDPIEAIDGRGSSIIATLRLREGPPRLEFLEKKQNIVVGGDAHLTSVLPIVLEMAVLKGDAMEWVIEKSVELGVGRLIPVL